MGDSEQAAAWSGGDNRSAEHGESFEQFAFL